MTAAHDDGLSAGAATADDASAADDSLVADFLRESRQSLDLIAPDLASCGAGPDSAGTLATAARILHTIKGAAGFIGLPRLAAVTHAAEGIIARDRPPPAAGRLALLLVSIGWIRGLVIAAEANAGREPPGADDELIALIEAAQFEDVPASGAPPDLAMGSPAARERVETDPPRAMPMAGAFGLLPAIVTGLAGQLGREIELNTTGGDVEVHPRILTALGGPLVQLVRNAAAHGLEEAQVRRASGKPARGCVRLGARRDGADIVVEVSDDGRGLDIAAIGARALELGLIDEAALAMMSDGEIARLAFRQGLSTTSVSTLSGRGVGLDIVAEAVASLGGMVEVRTERGKGCAFMLRFPAAQPDDRADIREFALRHESPAYEISESAAA